MKKLRLLSLCTVYFLLHAHYAVFAQDYRDLYKQAEELERNGKYKEATERAALALNREKKADAYALQGRCYQKLLKYAEEAAAWKAAVDMEPGNAGFKLNYATAGIESGLREEAEKSAKELLNDKQYKEKALIILSRANLLKKDYPAAMSYADEAAALNDKNFVPLFYRALAADSAGMLPEAIKFYDKAISLYESTKPQREQDVTRYRALYLNPARCSQQLNQSASVFKYTDKLLKDNPEDETALYVSAQAKYAMNEYTEAFSLLTKVIFKDQQHYQAFKWRGKTLEKLNRSEEALSDFNRAIVLYSMDAELYYLRALNQEKSGLHDKAKKDLDVALRLNPNQKEYKDFKEVMDNYNKVESAGKTSIRILKPFYAIREGVIYFPAGQKEVIVKGIIESNQQVQALSLNDGPVQRKGILNNEFETPVNAEATKVISFKVTFKSQEQINFNFDVRTGEAGLPVVALTSPVMEHNTFSKEAIKDLKIQVNGKVSDESYIESIIVNNQSAQFNRDELNPSFSALSAISPEGVLQIEIMDVMGNKNSYVYHVKKEEEVSVGLNPMGKTWVIFIENANYQKLSSLANVSSDVALVKKSLSQYVIDSVIVRKNMSRAEMERFFAVELRNTLSQFNVNSLLIWFAGHGKVTSDNGYWMPVDAGKQDEMTFFATSTLKGYLATYKSLKHTLVVADATETGPAFYLALRDTQKPRECGDYSASKYRSAQVLSCGDAEKGNERSVLAQTFYQTLTGTKDDCVSIDRISDLVAEVSRKSQKQKPRFGIIQNINDENGTFYFIKK